MTTGIKHNYNMLPEISREEHQPFWAGTRKKELRFTQCRDCKKFHWYPQLRCPHCGSKRIEWVKSRGRGRVYTWTVARQPFLPDYKDWVPYIVALIELYDAPGVRFITNVINTSPAGMAAGLEVEVYFHRITDDVWLPLFKPARAM